jgi:predicted DNA-binding transcriptional regulator AlpA
MKLENELIVIEQLPPRLQVLDRFLTRRDVLDHIGVSNTTLYALLAKNSFPKQIRIKNCISVVWSEFAVHQWMEEQKAGGVE